VTRAGSLHTPAARRSLIIDLVSRRELRSQEEICAALRELGVEVGQATLSRDLRELGLAKAAGRYVSPGASASSRAALIAPGKESGLARALRVNLVSADAAGHLVVLKTEPGKAPSTAVELDRARWKEVIGTVAGDDTILAVVRSAASARAVVRRVRALVE